MKEGYSFKIKFCLLFQLICSFFVALKHHLMHKAPVIPKIHLIYLQRFSLSCCMSSQNVLQIFFLKEKQKTFVHTKDNKYNIICKYCAKYNKNTNWIQKLNTLVLKCKKHNRWKLLVLYQLLDVCCNTHNTLEHV